MVQHILPKGFQRIRYYGLHATCRASKVREELKDLLKNDTSDSITNTYRVTGYRERIKEGFGIDPLLCPRCGNKMEFEGIWHPRYGWIVNNWDSFFIENPQEERDGEEESLDFRVWSTKSMVQLQMSFM